MNIYDFDVKARDGSQVSLSEYRGKVLLVVNTATDSGFTSQYDDLQAIYDEFRESGFEILDFPCNQFCRQAPGSDEEIHSFCTVKYGIAFPQFSKIEVIGENAEPLYKWLSENTGFQGFGQTPMGLMMNSIAKKMDEGYKSNGVIKWNFTKFLIDSKGNIAARFEATAPLDEVREKIKELI